MQPVDELAALDSWRRCGQTGNRASNRWSTDTVDSDRQCSC